MDTVAIYMISSAGLKALWAILNRQCGRTVPKHAEHVGQVSGITIYPFKSMGGLSLDTAECTQRGLKYPNREIFDRNFVVVDENGRFVSARGDPKMATISCSVDIAEFTLTCQGIPTLRLPTCGPINPHTVKLKVWGESVEGEDCGEEAARWISQCLDKPGCRMLYGREGLQKRELLHQEESWKKLARDGDTVTYQDGFPYMLLSEASVSDLTTVSGGETFAMSRFRPNLVVSGCKPFDEDSWDEIWIGEKAKFCNLKPCGRCVMTTVDPSTGKKNTNGEPLKTLRKYRLNKGLFGRDPLFGVNLVLDRTSVQEITVGDPVYVLRKGASF